jgi:hypothetical protein
MQFTKYSIKDETPIPEQIANAGAIINNKRIMTLAK